MPKKLDIPSVKWTGKLNADDLDILNAVHPGDVSAVIRALVGQYADRLRERLRAASAQH